MQSSLACSTAWPQALTEASKTMNLRPLRPVTEEEIQKFERDGFVHLENILSDDWVKLLDRTIEALAANPSGQVIDFTTLGMMAEATGTADALLADGEWKDPEKRAWASPAAMANNILREEVTVENAQRGHFVSMTGAFRRCEPINELVCKSPVPEIASRLMRSKKVYVYDDQVLLKPPYTLEKTAWHQDNGYDHVAGDQLLGIRIPTTRETMEMGPVGYLRGSHKDGVIYKVNYFISEVGNERDTGAPIPDIEGHEQDFAVEYCQPQPGDVVVHHLRTLHGAGGNRSKTTARKAITIRYAGDDARFLHRPFAPPQDVFHLKNGDPLDLDPVNHPVVWPR